MIKIDQFTPSLSVNDGVSSGVMYVQRLLQGYGVRSIVFASRIDRALKNRAIDIKHYIDSEDRYLIYHYSIAHNKHDEIMALKAKKILIYHNVTPSHFFAKNSKLYHLTRTAREQIRASVGRFVLHIADSEYNAIELEMMGYRDVERLALLVDEKKAIVSDDSYKSNHLSYNIVCVGRIVSNKSQHTLIRAIYFLKEMVSMSVKLYIIGKVVDATYRDYMVRMVSDLGLDDSVVMVDDCDDISPYYKNGDICVSLSDHEGFGMPLVEAMMYDCITLAYDNSAMSTTVPKESLLPYKNPRYVAGKIAEIMGDYRVRREIIVAQREHIKRFSSEYINERFLELLGRFGVNKKIDNRDKRIAKMAIEGPFDSTYSLSIVNQNMARELSKSVDVILYSSEGGGDFSADELFLEKNRDIAMMYKRREQKECVDVMMRNMYPPRTNAMSGIERIMGPYGWEESKFLPQYVEQFNSRASMVLTMSEYVSEVMINSGVKVPVHRVGLGVNHILKYGIKEVELPKIAGKRLLHISSAFARKGVDVLLSAYDIVIKNHSSCVLIIKTFENIHNNSIEMIENSGYEIIEGSEKYLLYSKNGSYIVYIDRELEQSEINYLYSSCDMLVAPSRGEGFGLPMAEAMLYNLPVITTGYGGQCDFCSDKSAWMIDYTLEPAKTHFNIDGSMWAEPDVESLVGHIEYLLEAPKDEIERVCEYAKRNILDNYKWSDVIERVKKVLDKSIK